jgi:4-carboxymuconolactone decarboxylase
MKYSPKYFKELQKRYPAVTGCFDELERFCAKAGPLDKKTQHFVKLGIAIGIGSEGDIQNITGQALDSGSTPDEVRQAILLSVTTAGFPAMIVAMQCAEEIIESRSKK